MTKKQIYLSIIFGVIFSIALYDYIPNLRKNSAPDTLIAGYHYKKDSSKIKDKLAFKDNKNQHHIEKLTNEEIVINYIKKNRALPEYYITKTEAKKYGWKPSEGNLCEVLPNRAIGGDRFGNREGKLPRGEQYYEADVNYRCGRRNSDRVIFNKNGEVWLTKDHYKTFKKQ